LSNNTDIGYTGINLIAKEFQNNAFLRELQLEEVTPWAVSETISETTEFKQSVNGAVMSVLNGLRDNMTLHVLRMTDRKLQFLDSAQLIPFYQHLNRNCKRSQLLREQPLPSSYWCFILERFCLMPSVIFYYLMEIPDLVPTPPK
jgi:hypothetical protein